MSFEYIEITDPLYVENKEQTGEENYIMVRAKQYKDVPIKIPNWVPQAHCFTTEFKRHEKELLEAEVYPDDVWVLSYPKSGTTWIQEMAWLICNDLNFEAARAKKISARFPFLEIGLQSAALHFSFKDVKDMPRPRFIKSHLPVSMLPKRYWEVKPKTIHIRRNPKSVAVSYFYHSQGIHYRGSMDTFLRSFVREHQFYSPYHAHVIEYHELRDCDNILHVSFEEMKRYLPSVVRKVCQFFGKSYSKAELELLYQHVSFKSMRDNPAVNFENPKGPTKGEPFMRKGEADGWKKELTPEQIHMLDEWTKERVPNPEHRKLFE
ncbi:luciferin sulfotransferase-like [Anopheles arabiensis]|uniref:Sulfotransferase domain-containing protein n=1 Tax=Anopheles arabiensis TaxID=7173 RepID=A0A1Y9GKW1_ANOAR|nr:luciferin sulfotransferase-like [Anopheles arabiensis]